MPDERWAEKSTGTALMSRCSNAPSTFSRDVMALSCREVILSRGREVRAGAAAVPRGVLALTTTRCGRTMGAEGLMRHIKRIVTLLCILGCVLALVTCAKKPSSIVLMHDKGGNPDYRPFYDKMR